MSLRTPGRRWLDGNGNEIDEEDRGLAYDVETLLSRRRTLSLFGGLGVAALVAGCGGRTTGNSSSQSATSAGVTTSRPVPSGDVTEVPDETEGRFPETGRTGSTCSTTRASSVGTSPRASAPRPRRPGVCR